MNKMKCAVDMANGLPCHWCVNYQWINIYSGLSNPRIITLPAALLPTLSVRHFGTSANCPDIKEDIAAPGNTGPNLGKEDSCACVITWINWAYTAAL